MGVEGVGFFQFDGWWGLSVRRVTAHPYISPRPDEHLGSFTARAGDLRTSGNGPAFGPGDQHGST